MVGNVENTCIQESSRSLTAANWPWIHNPRRRGTEFMHSFFLSPLSLYLTNPAHPAYSNKMIQNPWPLTGNHSTFFQLLLMSSMKKVIMVVQPDLLQLAYKWRQTSASAAPRVPTKKRKMITRRVIKKLAQASPSPSESNTNQVTHLSKTSSLLRNMYSGWM